MLKNKAVFKELKPKLNDTVKQITSVKIEVEATLILLEKRVVEAKGWGNGYTTKPGVQKQFIVDNSKIFKNNWKRVSADARQTIFVKLEEDFLEKCL